MLNGINIMKPIHALILLLGIFGADTLFAAQYLVTLDATVNNDLHFPQIFGSQTALPLHVAFTVDTALAPVTTIPAGTVIVSLGAAFPTDVQLISKVSITNFSLTVGTGHWTAADFLSETLDNPGQTFDIAIVGKLANGPVGFLAVLSNASGELILGGENCAAQCSLITSGEARSGSDGGIGTISGISATVMVIQSSPQTDLANLAATISVATNIKSDWRAAALLALSDITKAVNANKKTAAELLLALFIDGVKVAEIVPPRATSNLSGITAAQAAQFISAAKAIAAEIS
jgi:hypothetical protein